MESHSLTLGAGPMGIYTVFNSMNLFAFSGQILDYFLS